jgi:hypothetical protein
MLQNSLFEAQQLSALSFPDVATAIKLFLTIPATVASTVR